MPEYETQGGDDSQALGFADDLSKAFDEVDSEMPSDDEDAFETEVSGETGDDADILDGEIIDDADGALVEAPEHWSQEDKNTFAELPDEARPLYLAKVKSLESGFNRKFEELADERRGLDSYRGFHDLFRPFEEDLASAGITAEQYTRQLVATALQMRQNPEATLASLAKSHGVDLTELVGKLTGAGDPHDDDSDPDIRALKEQNQMLREELHGLATRFDHSQLSQQQAHQEQMMQDWVDFANAADENGQPLYPGAETLSALVGEELVRNPPALGETPHQTFARAYDTVKWLSPELRQSMLTAEREKARAAADGGGIEAQRKADVDKARRAGRTIRSKSTPVDEAPRDSLSWRDEVERQWDEAASAA